MSRSLSCSLLLLTSVSVLSLTSCETTGDPTQGGLFGWSQSKADVRIQEREDTLHRLRSDNYRQQSRKSSLQSERSRLQN
jgi:hypothetical protein